MKMATNKLQNNGEQEAVDKLIYRSQGDCGDNNKLNADRDEHYRPANLWSRRRASHDCIEAQRSEMQA
jgi:hypothetical protein